MVIDSRSNPNRLKPKPGKLVGDFVWNYVSLACLAGAGAGANLVIVATYPPEILGVFNLLFALFIVSSQFAVAGIHFSVLRAMAQEGRDFHSRRGILQAGMLLSCMTGFIVTALMFLSRHGVAFLFSSPALGDGLAVLAPAIFFFAQSKVLMSALNGLQRMRWFAFAQILRSVSFVGFVFVACTRKMEGQYLTAAFLVSEMLVSAFTLIPNWRYLVGHGEATLSWIRKHAHFGMNGFFSGVFFELNSRVDVLVLGLLLTDREVGIYSFAALFAEGYCQLIAVIRNFSNPHLALILKNRSTDALRKMLISWRLRIYLWMLGGLFACVFGFWLIKSFLVSSQVYGESFAVFSILATSIWLVSGIISFDGILLQAGFPGRHSLLFLAIMVSNIFLNLILVPLIGVIGAALATGASFILGGIYLICFVKRCLVFNIL